MTPFQEPQDRDAEVVELPEEVVRNAREEPPPPRPPSRLHGLTIAGMALCALVGIVAMFAFITIRWPGDTSRYVITVFVASGVGFLACASAAIFTAARDTYATKKDE